MAQKTTILLVDDDADEREIFEIALSSLGKEVEIYNAANGHDALKKIIDPSLAKPDFIFLDLNMPLMNGFQLLENIRKDSRFSNIPVVIYSTSSEEKDISTGREMGALHFFIKPFNISSVIQILSKILNKEELPYLLIA